MVEIPITHTKNCKKAYPNEKLNGVDDKVLCAGAPEGGKDSCLVFSSFNLIDYRKQETNNF